MFNFYINRPLFFFSSFCLAANFPVEGQKNCLLAPSGEQLDLISDLDSMEDPGQPLSVIDSSGVQAPDLADRDES